MPVENERKYLLSLTPDHIDDLVNDHNGTVGTIRQAYVGDARLRSIKMDRDSRTKYYFTWKSRRTDGSRIEIEKIIPKSDFNDLWAKSKNLITKRRVTICRGNIFWDIDFLYKTDVGIDHYLTIAESEMPEGYDVPDAIPDFVRQNLLYLVPRYKDDLWTNPHLTDPAQVSKMLAAALAEK